MKETIVKFPECDSPEMMRLEEEADAWLVRMDGDQPLSDEEREALREWLLRSPAHKQALMDQATLWSNMNVLTELSVPLGDRAGKSVWRCFSSLSIIFDWFLKPAVAATLGLVAIVAVGSMTFRTGSLPESNGFYATAIGQQKTAKLSDGSVVALNTNSQIEVAYSPDFRTIKLLQGETHFEVAKNLERPFRVYTKDGVFEAVGTTFSVRLEGESADLIVTEGAVAVAALPDKAGARVSPLDQGKTVRSRLGYENEAGSLRALGIVKAGQATAVTQAESPGGERAANLSTIRDVDPGDIERELSWREGFLTFSGEPLADAIEEISRYTTVSIEIADPNLKAIRIGGRVPIGETGEMLKALEINFDLRVTYVGPARIVIYAAG